MADEPTTQEQTEPSESEREQAAQPQPKYTDAQLQEAVDAAMAKARRKAEQEAEKKARQDEEQRLKDQQDFKSLAEKQAKQITELETRAAEVETAQSQVERYKGALTSILQRQREGIPTPIISLLDRMDPVEQLEWIAANQDAVTPQRNGSGGIPPSPRGQSAPLPSREQLIAEEKTRRRAQYGGL